MKNYLNVLKKCPLFADINECDIVKLLDCLNAKEKMFQKDEFIFIAGSTTDYVGIVLSGSVHIIQEDYWGNRTILSSIESGGLFGETFSYANTKALPVSVTAHKDCSILLINCKKLLTTCSSTCAFHASLIKNMMMILAEKNVSLTKKINHITKKTTREKILSYLSECAVNSGNNTFQIPFNRQELADYLSVERSALSNTLCKMRDEGIIEFHKNEFRVLHNKK